MLRLLPLLLLSTNILSASSSPLTTQEEDVSSMAAEHRLDEYIIRVLRSHWSRSLEAVLSLVEIMVLLGQLSYAIKTPLKTPKTILLALGRNTLPGHSCLSLCLMA